MEREDWHDVLTDGRRRPTTCSTTEGSRTGVDEGAWRRDNLRSTARRSEDVWANAAVKCRGDNSGPLTGEEEGCGAFGSDCSGDRWEKVARRLAPARRQAAPACSSRRVSDGWRCKERGGATLLIGAESRRGEWRRLQTGLPKRPYTGARAWHHRSQPIKAWHPATEWLHGGSHLPTNFPFPEIPKNRFLCKIYIYIYIYI
jgi:hypothetical protein